MTVTAPATQLDTDQRYLATELNWLRLRFEYRMATLDPENADRLREIGDHLHHAAAERVTAAALLPRPAMLTLSRRFELSSFEHDVLLLCLGMELDPMTAARCSAVSGDGAPHPTFALALQLFDDPAWEALSPWRPLRADRLLAVASGPGRPLLTAPLQAEEAVVHFAKGLIRVTPSYPGQAHSHLDGRLAPWALLEPSPTAPLTPSYLALINRVLAVWSGHALAEPPVVNLVGPTATGTRQIAATVAAAAACDLFRFNATDLAGGDGDDIADLWRRDRRLHSLMLLLEADGRHPDIGLAVRRFLERAGGLRVLASRDPLPIDPIPHVVIEVGWVPVSEQAQVWADALPAEQVDIAQQLANRFRLDTQTIIDLAGSTERADGSVQEGPELVRRCRAATRPDLAGIATWVEPRAQWNDLVLPAATEASLRDIVAQVRHRSVVLYDWGFAEHTDRGWSTSAMFSGPSGTGKTRAAEVLAHELDTPLCQVDLSVVVSKYIGETEKNLARVFDAADASNALLLFDEADALFGKRSEVRHSHDRYANIEISYLLQRLEGFGGLTVLSTNMASSMDAAFLRRLRFVVPFAFPTSAERRKIWAQVFPDSTPVDELDLDALATLPASGAMIRNMAIHAAFAAAACGGAVTHDLILRAARRELDKTGQLLPDALLAQCTTTVNP